MKNKFGYNIKHNKVFKADKTFVTKVAWAVAARAIPFLCNFRANFAAALRDGKAANAG